MMRNRLFIGTYTQKGSKGIYQVTVDMGYAPETSPKLAAEMMSPTWLLLSGNGKILYAVSEAQPGIHGEIAAFHCTEKGLTLINKVLAPGAGLVHAILDPEEKLLFAVSYRDAGILMYEIREDGGIGTLLDGKVHIGQGRDPVRQEKAHAHSVWMTPDGMRICVCDLGIDRLVVYEVDRARARLVLREELGVAFLQGAGPRHLVFHPNGRFAYVAAELTSEIFTLEYSCQNGFKIIGKEPALCQCEEYSIGAAIRISGDGRYLYSSNRGADDIAVYRISDHGRIRRILNIPCRGQHPRDFILASCDRYLLCANRDTDNITVWLRDSETGGLGYLREIKGISMPVCVVNLPLDQNGQRDGQMQEKES